MKRFLIIVFAISVLFFLQFILAKSIYAQVCPIDVIGSGCHQAQGVVYEERPTADCSTTYSFNTNVSCDYNSYSALECGSATAVSKNKCTTGQICDCRGTGSTERCRIPGKTPNGISCCSDQVCQSGYCNQTTGKCEARATLTPTITSTPPTPTAVATRGITERDIEPYRPSFDSLLKNALLILPVFFVIYLLF